MLTGTCAQIVNGALNVTTLYNLGFYLNTGYAYDRKYGSVFECLKENYFSHDLVDLNKID